MGNDYIKNVVSIIFFAVFYTWITMILIAQNTLPFLSPEPKGISTNEFSTAESGVKVFA